MRLLSPAAFALTAILVSAASAPADDKDAAADLKALVGKWTIEKSELGGKDITEVLKVLQFEIMPGGKYVAKHGESKDEGTFTVDPGKKPKRMDIKTGETGPSKGKTMKAVYKLDGDELVICYQFGGGDYPAKFESPAGTQLLLTTYKRKK